MDTEKIVAAGFAFFFTVLIGGMFVSDAYAKQLKAACIVALKDKSAAEIYTVCHK